MESNAPMRLPICLALIFLLLSAGFAAPAQPPTPEAERTKAQWIAYLKEGDDTNSIGMEQIAPLLARSPDFTASVVQEAWPQIQNNTVRAMLVTLIAEAAENPNGTRPPAPAPAVLNTHVLEILALGLNDRDANVQESARDTLEKLAGQKFTGKSARDWIQQNVRRVPADVVREGIRTLAAQLATAEPGMKMAILDRLREMRFAIPSAAPVPPDGKEIRAAGYAIVRRQAALDAGLLDTVAKLLHDGAGSPLPDAPNAKPDAASILRRKALAFLAVLQPDASDLPRLEDDIKKEYAARGGNTDALQNVPITLLLRYKADWAIAALNRMAERIYLGPNCAGLINELTDSGDLRAVPLFMTLLGNVGTTEEEWLRRGLFLLTKLPEGETFDAAAWQAWWKKSPDTLPAAIRSQPVPHLPAPREALVLSLTGFGNYYNPAAIQQFAKLGYEAQWELLRDNWTKIGLTARGQLLTTAIRVHTQDAHPEAPNGLGLNPHLLAILDLGMNDPEASLRNTANALLYYHAGQKLNDPQKYAAWYAANKDLPLAEVERNAVKTLVANITAGRPEEQAAHIVTLARIAFNPRRAASASGRPLSDEVIKLPLFRRQSAIEAGALEKIAKLLHNPPGKEVRTALLQFLTLFQPDETFLKRVEPDVRRIAETALAAKPLLDSAALGALPLFKTRWAADLLLSVIATHYSEQTSAVLITAALKMTDPRLIPTLIALLDTVESNGWAAPQINAQLAVLTRTAPDNSHDAAYWRGWWNQHIAELPEEVRRMPFPRLSLSEDAAKAFSIRQDARYIEMGKDRNRAYWRVMSGRIIALPTRPLPVSASDSSPFGAIPVNDRPGLLICFLPEGGKVAAFRDFWWHLDQRAFEGKYYIALIAPPVESDKKTVWPLRPDEKDKDRPTAQSRVQDVVRDMLAQAPINPARIFVLGVGDGGMAATACALDKSTPAHGFILIDAPFRSAELPPLGTIRGRKVVLIHNKRDHTLPDFVLTAAQKTLLQNGASLTRTDYDAAIGKEPLTVPFETLGAAIAALEVAR